MTLEEFVNGFTEEEIEEAIENEEELQETGALGNCVLRSKTEEFMKLNNINHPIILFMNQIAKAALKRKYNESKGGKHEQFALVEFDNTAPQIIKYKSKDAITLDRIVKRIEETEPDVNWEKDSVALFSEIYEEDLDQ